jgi:hypothetical protein
MSVQRKDLPSTLSRTAELDISFDSTQVTCRCLSLTILSV